MSATEVVQLAEGSHRSLIWTCVGCGEVHCCAIDAPDRPRWAWNRSLSKPTLVPSILKRPAGGKRCHSFVKDGIVEFLGDCDHDLAGRSVAMLPENAGIPRDPE